MSKAETRRKVLGTLKSKILFSPSKIVYDGFYLIYYKWVVGSLWTFLNLLLVVIESYVDMRLPNLPDDGP